MPQTDSEQIIWFFIGLACLAFLGMAFFNALARHKGHRKSAKSSSSAPRSRRERVAARPHQLDGLPPIPEHLLQKAPVKPVRQGPGRPSVLVVEGTQTHQSLLLLQRADALETDGHVPGNVRLVLKAHLKEENTFPHWLAARARALAWEPECTLAYDVWCVSIAPAIRASMDALIDVTDDESVQLRALDCHGQSMGEPVLVHYKKAELLRATRQFLAHEEPGVLELLEGIRRRMAELEALGNCDGALMELPSWLDRLAQILEAQTARKAINREALLKSVIEEVQQKKVALTSAVPPNMEALCATECALRLAFLERATLVEKSSCEQVLIDASSVLVGEKQIEAMGGDKVALLARMKTDAADVVALLDLRMLSFGLCARLLVRFD